MSKLAWFIVAFLIAAGLVATYFNRSANKELLPYLGKWSGGFMVEQIDGKANPALAKRASLTGYLQLYGSNDRFELRLNGEQQEVVVTGTWQLVSETQIELKPEKYQIDDFGGAENRDPNLVYVPNDAVRAAYGKALALSLSSDKQTLIAPLSSIGPLTGIHQFKRVGSGR